MPEPVDWPTRDLVTHRVEATPDRTAVERADGERAWTYRDLDAATAEVAAVVDAHVPGDGRVAALVDGRMEVAPLLFGAMRRGVTLAPLNVDLGADALRAQTERLDPDLLVCERGTESRATAVADCPVVSVDDPGADGVAPIDPEGGTADPVPLARGDTQLVLFTSGTTGDPKGVRLTVGNLVASATASAFRLGTTPADRWLACLPTYHMGGLAPFLRCALYGATVVVQREFGTERTAAALADRDATGVSLVPTMLSRLLDAGWEPDDSLRFVLLGGGPAGEGLVERCRERDVPVCPTYGMTETASQIATALPETAVAHAGTVGQPLLFTDVTVVDGSEPVERGERGELVVDGPTVAPGYLDDDATGAAFGPHGFHTGDLGYRDEDGRLWVVGRADDRIVTGGETVRAGDVSATLRACDGVDDAAVVGLPDEEWGERVGALVAGSAAPEAVLAHARDELAPYEVPKTLRVVDALPRTPSGTVDHDAVRERLRE